MAAAAGLLTAPVAVDTHSDHTRVILHIDLDGFYAQVEQVRLGLGPDVPVAVQQWANLIAMNYAAKAKGVTRMVSATEAKRLCPGIHCIHVETIGPDGAPCEPGTGLCKVSLQRYRTASAKIFNIFVELAGEANVEKAGLDEGFLNVTHLIKPLAPGADLTAIVAEHADWVVEGGKLDSAAILDARLVAGATIAAQVRAKVFSELGYTCSAGVAHNKMLAKLASARNKPNKQTLVPMSGIPGLMETLPLRKIRFLGGKLGKSLELKTAGEVQKLSIAELQSKIQSMLAAKSFSATSDMAVVKEVMSTLAVEIMTRLGNEEEESNRTARTLALHHRGLRGVSHSKSCPMPAGATKDKEAVYQCAMRLLQKMPKPLPVSHLSLQAIGFSDGVIATGAGAITSFLSAASSTAAAGGSVPIPQPIGSSVFRQPKRKLGAMDSFMTARVEGGSNEGQEEEEEEDDDDDDVAILDVDEVEDHTDVDEQDHVEVNELQVQDFVGSVREAEATAPCPICGCALVVRDVAATNAHVDECLNSSLLHETLPQDTSHKKSRTDAASTLDRYWGHTQANAKRK